MNSPLIKICGIRGPEIAREAVLAGAQFIGIIFHQQSKRCIDIENAKKISAVVKEHGGIPTAVFVEESAQEMRTICTLTDIHCIQLHGQKSREQHHLLPEDLQRIYVQTIKDINSIESNADLLSCHPERDFLLFDNEEAGSGKTFAWEECNYTGPFRFFVAGGLTANNVNLAITQLHPAGVDVSSGVENQAGEKDIVRIQQFIHAVHKGISNAN